MGNIYESDAFRTMPDGSMHPGGLRLSDRAFRLSGLKQGMTAADLGCGAGATAAYLGRTYRLQMTGLDASSALIGRGKQLYPGLNLICHDCRDLPFSDASLDAVFMECSLSVLGRREPVLSAVYRVLRPDGLLILSDLCARAEGKADGVLPTADSLKSEIENAGFRVNILEDHTDALKTYAAELAGRLGGFAQLSECLCGGNCPAVSPPRLRDLGYALLIAEKLL